MRRLVVVGEAPNETWVDQPDRVHPLFGGPARKLALAAGWSSPGETAKAHYRALLRRARLYNLCRGRWDDEEARLRAAQLWSEHPDAVFVLLGRRVSAALGHDENWYEYRSDGLALMVAVPHPSGLSRLWNGLETQHRAGAVLREAEALSRHGWS